VIAVNPSSVVLLLDVALLAVLAVVVQLLRMQNGPDKKRFARAVRRTNEVAASTVPTRYMKEPT